MHKPASSLLLSTGSVGLQHTDRTAVREWSENGWETSPEVQFPQALPVFTAAGILIQAQWQTKLILHG